MQKRILCFGDSNTHGYIPQGGRYDENTRWPMRLGQLLGPDYGVIEEGFNGRTLVFDDPVEGGFKSGYEYLPPCLMSHNPLEMVIIMLGTNDTKRRFGMSAQSMGQALMQVVRRTKQYAINNEGKTSRVLVVAPPPILDNLMEAHHGDSFGPQAIELSHALAHEYRRMTKLMRCDFFDAAPFAEVSTLDAVHMTAKGHLQLAQALADKIRTMC